MKPAVKLAQLAIAFEQAHAVFFPASAVEMAELGSAVMSEEGIGFWISSRIATAGSVTSSIKSQAPNERI